jgi:hypothetical protein
MLVPMFLRRDLYTGRAGDAGTNLGRSPANGL